MANFTAAQLCEFALAMVGQPYWYGTCVYQCTLSRLNSKTKQYPSHYTDARRPTYLKHIEKKMVCADCVGLIKGFFWTNGGKGVIESIGTGSSFSTKYQGNGMPDKGANSIMEWCKSKGADNGSMASFPHTPGAIMHKDGHVGIYVGNNQVVEARGFAYGIMISKLSAVKWTDWALLPSSVLDYSETTPSLPEEGQYYTKISNYPYYATVERFNEERMLHNGLVIAKVLMDYGWTANAVAGILGNIQSESGCNPHAYYGYQEYSATSFGLVQWDPTSKYEEWAEANGFTPYYDIEYQCNRIIYEFENGIQYYSTDSYPISASEFVKSKSSAYDLACAFAWNYERSAVVLNGSEAEKETLRQQRGGQAMEWYERIKNGVSDGDFDGDGTPILKKVLPKWLL